MPGGYDFIGGRQPITFNNPRSRLRLASLEIFTERRRRALKAWMPRR